NTENATCAPTSNRPRRRNRTDADVPWLDCSTPARSTSAARQAETSPNSNTLSTQTTDTKDTVRMSAWNVSASSTTGTDSIATTIDTAHAANKIPAMHPAAARSIVSTSECATSRARLAPSAARVVNSRRRDVPRSITRLPTLAHVV